MLNYKKTERQGSRHLTGGWIVPRLLFLYFCVGKVACAGSVVLTQTHPAAPYVCRTGNITLRCQYGGVENVLVVLWAIGNATTAKTTIFPGHTTLPRTTTYQELVVDNYTNLRERYQCISGLSNGTVLTEFISNVYEPQIESAEVTLSSLRLASRTATTLSVIWSAGYPKCYSFAVFHSTQDSSITLTQPANNDTSHILTSLQSGTTYRIEVEAVRKGNREDGQRARVMENFTTEGEGEEHSSATSTTSPPGPGVSSETDTATTLAGGIVGGLLALVIIIIAGILIAVLLMLLVLRRKTVFGATASAPKAHCPRPDSTTQGRKDSKQTYAVLDWQNPEQRPVKAPDNEWFTVQYSEVQFDSTK